MIPANENFEGTFPFTPHFSTVNGFKMHYVDEGDGDVLVCLHGEPTWGYLYRNFIPPLSETHRVIVPDHMGFGKSETPQDRKYRFGTHVENLINFIDDLGLRNITFIAQDWGAPIAGSIALRRPELVGRFCLMNGLLGYGRAVTNLPKPDKPVPKITDSSWFTWIRNAYDQGIYHEIMQHLGVNVLSIMKKLNFVNSAAVDEQWLRAYTSPFKTVEEAIGAVEFPLDVALNRMKDYVIEGLKFGNLEKVRAKPAMLAVGLQDKAMPSELIISDFKRLFPHGPVVKLENAGHFCQEDAPETLVALIQQFIQMTDLEVDHH